MELSGDAAILLEQGRYADLLAAITDPPSEQDILAAVRCRADQGCMRAAAALLRDAPLKDKTARLWAGFLGLYLESDTPFAQRAAAFEALCDNHPDALAKDLRSRTAVFRYVLSGLGPGGRAGPITALVRAADT